MMKKYLAEMIGTFTLVLLGCGTAVIAGPQVGMLGISFAFGLALIAMAYGIGPISGCHINPAVSLAVFTSGKMTMQELMGYIVSQCIGAILGAGCLYMIMKGQAGGYDLAASGLGQNGWGTGYLGQYDMTSAMIFEFVATLLFVITILGVTQEGSPKHIAGIAIGLTLVVIHICGIQITGVSVNPARSLGPALIVGGHAMEQLWLFLVVPSFAGVMGGLMFKTKLLEAPSAS
jgi:aquaporin Z